MITGDGRTAFLAIGSGTGDATRQVLISTIAMTVGAPYAWAG